MSTDFTKYQLIVPLADFVVRFGMFTEEDKQGCIEWINNVDFELWEREAILVFLATLEKGEDIHNG